MFVKYKYYMLGVWVAVILTVIPSNCSLIVTEIDKEDNRRMSINELIS